MLSVLAMSAAFAADHMDATDISADPAADINDVYAWVDGSDVYFIVTYAGLGGTGSTLVVDPDVLYTIHVDVNADGIGDENIQVQFGSNGVQDALRVRFNGGPSVIGRTDHVTVDGSNSIWSGVKDDPFFFDLNGFNNTLDSGDLSFTGVDAVAGLNTSGFAIKTTLGQLGDPSNLSIWATTSRLVE